MSTLANLSRMSGLPTPLKVVAGVAAGGAVLGAVFYLLGDSPSRNMAMIIIAVGVICVALLFLAFKALVKWNNKRKASPLTQGIAGNAAAAPQGISEPARRARLDDLRRNFEQGVEKFRAAGKNLYSVPWYVLVGEPGSGKTEAIRHCNVGFPPGLQDQLQGAGGTLNMNWWFTNQAIILDTAGRLMFEEVPAGSTNEWAEFLKLLRQNRPNSPLNGMLLVIPVDTLIKDSADAIEKKATKIAQQFDQIQRTLGVRFPVFVIISKCDLLNGFREFFDDLNDPQLQHQIMGWSNPAPLDERFDPAKVTDHLETVKHRLFARRQNLLLDPVNTEDPQSRRVDQVDSLYALPDSITKIGPRLRRYLEMIFVAGEWSPKPLFLRGIYFTSSMTEGAALDAELAEALGVPVDSLPGGAIFRKDRAYFLRDLFVEKVFREKGLVTRATNADKQQRSRRTLVLSFTFIAVICLFAVTWFASRSLNKSLGADRNLWESIAGNANRRGLDLNALAVIDKRGSYFNDSTIPVGSTPVSLPSLFSDNLGLVQHDLEIPFVFRPMAAFSGNINDQRRAAYRDLFASTVLRPAFTIARGKIAGDWDPKKGPALVQLMKLEYAKATGKSLAGDPHPQVEIAPLFALSLSDDDYQKFTKDNESLQKVADWVYTAPAKGDADWPPAILLPKDSTANADAIKIGIDSAIAYWKNQTTDDGKNFESIKTVRSALNDFRAAEAALNLAKSQPIDRLQGYHTYREVWVVQMGKLRDAAKRASDAWTQATGGKADVESLRKLYEDQKNRTGEAAKLAYDALLANTPAADGSVPKKDAGSYQSLLDARSALEQAKKDLGAWAASPSNKATLEDLSALDAAYFGRTIKSFDKQDHHRFEVHQQLYELADKSVIRDDASVQLAGALDASFSQIDRDYADTTTTLKAPLIAGGDALTQAGALAQFTLDASIRAKKYLLADVSLKNMPDTSDKWQTIIKTATAKGPLPDSLRRPAVPMVVFAKDDKLGDDEKTFSTLFAPDAAGEASDRLITIEKSAAATDAATRILDPVDLKDRAAIARKGFDAYKAQYVEYWRDTAGSELKFNFAKYADFNAALVNVTEPGIRGALEDYGKKMTAALDRIGAADAVNALKSAPRVIPAECSTMLSRWYDLGNDPRQARRSVLSKDATLFRNEYFVATARSRESYIAAYWNDLPLAALRILASDGRKDIDDSLSLLSQYERFPFALPGDKKDDLTQDDVLKARDALIKVRGDSSATSGAGGSAKLIGQGGGTAVIEIDNILERLRGTDLFKNKQDYYEKLDRFLAAMPADAKPLSATLSVNKTKLSEATDAVSLRFSYLQISQDKKGLQASLMGNVADNVSIDYSGGDLTLGFREVQGGAIIQTDTFAGPWAVFRLLKSPNTKSATRDPANPLKWNIEYTVITADKKSFSLWLTLEFKQPVPDLKDWPVPPGKT